MLSADAAASAGPASRCPGCGVAVAARFCGSCGERLARPGPSRRASADLPIAPAAPAPQSGPPMVAFAPQFAPAPSSSGWLAVTVVGIILLLASVAVVFVLVASSNDGGGTSMIDPARSTLVSPGADAP